jgi:Holliday junction DNA helicase RuvB
MGSVDKALDSFQIIKDGYTEKDLKMLKYIALNEKGVGLQGLSAYLGVPNQSLIYDVEPYLLTNGLIVRSPRGRKITDKGRVMIEELEK